MDNGDPAPTDPRRSPMPDLFPTKTRLALLQDVADGHVAFSTYDGTVLNLATLPPRRVLSETAEMRQAGWVTVDIREGADTLGSYPYELTDLGRAVLNAPSCTHHGPMKLRPTAGQTKEQQWCGTWYDCVHPRCGTSALVESTELRAQLDQQAEATR